MLINPVVRQTFSLVLSLTLLLSPTLVSASDNPHRNVAGSVIAAGRVELRGSSITGEGTLFMGDAIRTGKSSYGKMFLTDGNSVELFSDTECVLSQGDKIRRVGLRAGNLGFTTSRNPIAITLGRYEVLPKPGTSGGVEIFGEDFAGIRVIRGSVVVRDVASQTTVEVMTGSVHIVNLKTGKMNIPLAQMASSAPAPLPSGSPIPQGGRVGGLTPTQWGIIIAGIGAGATTVIYFAIKDASPSKP